jgi:hypothetical protein
VSWRFVIIVPGVVVGSGVSRATFRRERPQQGPAMGASP